LESVRVSLVKLIPGPNIREQSGLLTRIAMERVSLSARRISCKFPLCDSRIGDNVKKRGWSLGWVLSGATRVSKEKFSFLSGSGNPTQTNETIH